MFIKDLEQLIHRVKVDEDDTSDILRELKRILHRSYLKIVQKKWFRLIFFLFFIAGGIYSLARGFYYFGLDQEFSFWVNGFVFSAALAGLFTLIGLV